VNVAALPTWLRPTLTPARIGAAFAVAIVADIIQILLGPLGWFWPDEIIDVFTAIVTMLAIGFHPLLLPTFIVELVPIVDMLPTWTGCVAAVVMLRRRQQRAVV
jgi:hypothetical protein